jgi:hypothetical protein
MRWALIGASDIGATATIPASRTCRHIPFVVSGDRGTHERLPGSGRTSVSIDHTDDLYPPPGAAFVDATR